MDRKCGVFSAGEVRDEVHVQGNSAMEFAVNRIWWGDGNDAVDGEIQEDDGISLYEEFWEEGEG